MTRKGSKSLKVLKAELNGCCHSPQLRGAFSFIKIYGEITVVGNQDIKTEAVS